MKVRTYTVEARHNPRMLRSACRGIVTPREILSPWSVLDTELGPLNQIIHVWPYENLQHRMDARTQAMKDPNWPPKLGIHREHGVRDFCPSALMNRWDRKSWGVFMKCASTCTNQLLCRKC